jgi:RES domain-containing protein
VIPLPPPLGAGEVVAWRLDRAVLAATWDSGEGAFRAGGRWNSRGVRAVYASLDPATAILEVAVHTGFAALDTVAHVLTAVRILDPSRLHVVQPEDVPNPNWLRPGIPSGGQQGFGDALLAAHPLVLIPSAVSIHSWNLIFIAAAAAGLFALKSQERFALDPRLASPA